MTEHAITSPSDALKFLLAGKATFTVRSEKTGEHLTYQVRNWKKARDGTLHFVSVRTGNDYARLGRISNGRWFAPGHQRTRDVDLNDKTMHAFRYVFEHLQHNRMPPKAEIWHEGTCGRCNRALTDPESILRGIGPECIKKMECV